MTESPVVSVEHGKLQGRNVTSPSGKTFYSFQGIPYAKPPLGSLRFKAPQPVEPWEGVREATAEGNVSAQIDPLIHKEYIGDENCLFLNVYTPNLDGEFLPVMVFIHGGGFKFGSGNTSLYGADYLVEKDVVVVTINYRCGALGFLCLNTPEIPGNAGLKDMVQAIRWVKENIQNFGGNAGNVTVFGESAGGVATSILTASPLTKDLINRVIIQSGTALNSWAFQKNPLEKARNLAKICGCESEDIDDILEFLTTTPVRDLIDANAKMHTPESFYEKGSVSFGPVIEKEFSGVEAVLTESFVDLLTSGRLAEVPVMIGSTSLEFTFEKTLEDLRIFIPDDFKIERNSDEAVALADKIKHLYFKSGQIGVANLTEYFQLLSDKLINIDTHRYVKYLVKVSNKPIYYYKFDYVGELNISKKLLTSLGLNHAAHMDELGYLFKNILQKDVELTPDDEKMREIMLGLWTNFAKSGNPTPEENNIITANWQPVTKDNLYYMNLSTELSLDTNPDKEKMEFWEGLYEKYYKIWEHPKINNEPIPEKAVVEETKIEESVNVEESKIEEAVNVEESKIEEAVKVEESNIKEAEIKPEEPKFLESKVEVVESEPEVVKSTEVIDSKPEIVESKMAESEPVVEETKTESVNSAPIVVETTVIKEVTEVETKPIIQETIKKEVTVVANGHAKLNGNDEKPKTSNEIKMVQNGNGVLKDVIRANDPPEDDLPKNIGVNKFVNFFESLGGKK